MRPILPQQIAEVSGRLFALDEVLTAVSGVSDESRAVFWQDYDEANRELRTLRREFKANQKALDADRLSG